MIVAAHVYEATVLDHEWRHGDAIEWARCGELFGKIAPPDGLARFDLSTCQDAADPKREHAPVGNGGRALGPFAVDGGGWIHLVWRAVAKVPGFLAVGQIVRSEHLVF